MHHIIYADDLDTVSILVKLQPSIWDPAGQYKAHTRTFRIVHSAENILELVPISFARFLTKDEYRPSQDAEKLAAQEK